MDGAVDRTSVVKCRIVSVSCKQRCGAWEAGKEPGLDGPEGNGQGWKGGVPCWTQWGELAGYGRDGERLRDVLEEKSQSAKTLAMGSLWASDQAKIDGLGRRMARNSQPDVPLSTRM